MQTPLGPLDDCNVFVKYLPHDLTDTELYKMFKSYGTIVSSKIMVDQTTGKSLGYGFVRFASAEDASKAITCMNGHRIMNKRLLCKLANQSPSASFNPEFIKNPLLVTQTPSNNLYIKPLLSSTSEENLREMFARFGTILECKVMVDRYTGASRQIGFVRFSTVEEATLALDSMNTVKLDAASPPLVVKYADTKEQKTARKSLRSQFLPDSPLQGTTTTNTTTNSFSPVTSPLVFYSTPPYPYPFYSPGFGYASYSPPVPPASGSEPNSPAGFVPSGLSSSPVVYPGLPYPYFGYVYGDSPSTYVYGDSPHYVIDPHIFAGEYAGVPVGDATGEYGEYGLGVAEYPSGNGVEDYGEGEYDAEFGFYEQERRDNNNEEREEGEEGRNHEEPEDEEEDGRGEGEGGGEAEDSTMSNGRLSTAPINIVH